MLSRHQVALRNVLSCTLYTVLGQQDCKTRLNWLFSGLLVPSDAVGNEPHCIGRLPSTGAAGWSPAGQTYQQPLMAVRA